MSTHEELDAFLSGAREQGFLTDAAAEECRKIALVLMDVDNALPIQEIAVRKGFLTRKQADTVLRATAKRRIGPYEVVEKIGAGAVGRVFRARDTRDGTVVALKLLADSVKKSDGGERALERFLREARVASTLNHPNIVRGFGSGEDAGYTWMAMEYVPGETLEQRLARGKIPQKEAFAIARDVVRAFEHLSEFHLIHRDVKPGNIMLTPEGQVKVCDLGLTRPSLREAKELGVVEVPLGTAVYVSPEQIKRPDHIDWRADVYSLGATLYHMVAGSPPFTGDTPDAIAKKHMETPPRDPREFAIELSEGAANVILKMLQKDPAQRHASLVDLDADMQSVIDGRVPVHTLSAAPVPAKGAAPTHAARPARPAVPAKRSGGSGVLIAGAVIAAGAVGAWFALRGGDAPPAAGGGTPDATATAGSGTTPDAPGTGPAPTADGGSPTSPSGTPSATPPGAPTSTPAATSPADDAARTAFRKAMEYWRENPADYAEAQSRLTFVAERYKDTTVAAQARELLAEVASRLSASALREFDRRAAKADPAEAAGRLAEAWAVYQDFPVEFADTPAAKSRQAAQARIVEAARKTVDEAVRTAVAASTEGRFADARKALESAALAELPATEAALRTARDDVDALEASSTVGREVEREQFDDVWTRAVLAAAGGDAAGAAALAKEARPKLSRWTREIDDLAAALPEIARVEPAARKAWAASPADSVKLGAPGRPKGVVQGKPAGLSGEKIVIDAGAGGKVALDLREVAAEDVARIAARALDARSAADQRALLHYLLGRRATAAAKEQVEVLRVAGGAADTAASDVQRVERRTRAEIDVFLRRAEAARREKRLPDARAALAEAERLAPGDPSVQLAVAQVALAAGSIDEARPILERLAARKDAPPEARLRLGQILAQKGDADKARVELEAFLAAAPADDPLRPEGEAALAEIVGRESRAAADAARKNGAKLYQAKKWGDAEVAYAKVLEAVPDDADALLRIGVCHARQNEAFEAWRRLTQFVRANGTHPKLAEAQKELQALEPAKAIRPADRASLADATKAMEEGKFDDAVTTYGRALAYSPFLDAARLGLARALLARGKAATSRDDLNAALAAIDGYLFVNDAAADGLLARAETWFALGDYARAGADARRVSELDTTGAVAPMIAGESWFRLGKFRDARIAYAESHTRKPSAAALYAVATTDERLEYFDRAWDAYEELLAAYELTPEMRKDVNDAMRRIRPKISK